MVIYSALLVDR